MKDGKYNTFKLFQMPKTNAQKQADRRERLSCGGLFKRRDFYCHQDDEEKLRELEKKLQNERKKMHNTKGEQQ